MTVISCRKCGSGNIRENGFTEAGALNITAEPVNKISLLGWVTTGFRQIEQIFPCFENSDLI